VTSIDFEVKLQSAVLCNGREFKKSLIWWELSSSECIDVQ
jgi:hypothetical protein